MLLGAALVVALVRDRRDDAGLPGRPSRRSGFRRARAASSARRPPRRRGARARRPPSREFDPGDVAARREADDRVARSSRRRARSRPWRSAATTSSLNAIWASGFALARLELELLEPHRVAHAAVEDRHFSGSAAPAAPARPRRRRARAGGASPPPARPCAISRRPVPDWDRRRRPSRRPIACLSAAASDSPPARRPRRECRIPGRSRRWDGKGALNSFRHFRAPGAPAQGRRAAPFDHCFVKTVIFDGRRTRSENR